MTDDTRSDRGAPHEGAPRWSGATAVSVDDVWVMEWAADGIVAIERLLAAHAAFDAFLRARQDESDVDDDAGDRR